MNLGGKKRSWTVKYPADSFMKFYSDILDSKVRLGKLGIRPQTSITSSDRLAVRWMYIL